MRVAMLSFEHVPHWHGGIGNYTKQAASMLARRGHEVEVFSACPERAYDEPRDGVLVHFLECPDRRSFARVAADSLAREHERRPLDVVEAPDLAAEGLEVFRRFPDLASVVRLHTPSYLAAWVDRATFGWPAVAAHSVRIAFSEVLRGRWPKQAASFARMHWSLKSSYSPEGDEERSAALLADVMVAPSRRLAAEVESAWHLESGSVRVLPYPHQPDEEMVSLPVPRGEVATILYYGGIKGFKGVDVLAKAIPGVLQRHPRVRFIFAGKSQGSPFADLTPRAFIEGRVCQWQEMEVWLQERLSAFRESVSFLGAVDSAGIKRLLSEADICVFPSRFDNFPNACLEAMAAGRPIVATRSGGMEEMLGPTDAGLLVKPGNVRELTNALVRLIEDAAMRSAMAQRARQRVLHAYSDDVIGPLYEQTYAEAIEMRGKRREATGKRS